jgi:hypothetical protein
MSTVSLSLIALFVALSTGQAAAEERAPAPAPVPAPVGALASGGYDYEQCDAPSDVSACCGCLVTIKLQQNAERSGISWMSFIFDDGETRDAIRYGKKVPNRPDLMLKSVRVANCITPLSKVFQYQYSSRTGGDLGFAYIFWFGACAPAGAPYKVVVRSAENPIPFSGVSERSYVANGAFDRIFKLSFDYDSTRQEYTLTGGETIPPCIVCD